MNLIWADWKPRDAEASMPSSIGLVLRGIKWLDTYRFNLYLISSSFDSTNFHN